MLDKYYINLKGKETEVTKEAFQERRKKDMEDFLFKIKCNESFPKVTPYNLKPK